jgi:hypothetical protein
MVNVIPQEKWNFALIKIYTYYYYVILYML